MVAVVRRNSSYAFTLNELRGKRSCHPALGSPAGWDIPVGALVRRGFLQPRDCDVLTGAALPGNTGPLWDPQKAAREVSSSSLTWEGGNYSGDRRRIWWFCGGCHGAPTHLSPRVEPAPVGVGSGVCMGPAPTPSSPGGVASGIHLCKC